jgi:cardiolipin synthase
LGGIGKTDEHRDHKGTTRIRCPAEILSYGRIAAIPVVVGCVFAQSVMEGQLRWVALAVFIAAASPTISTAIMRDLGSAVGLGRMLDPIADKPWAQSCLLMLAADSASMADAVGRHDPMPEIQLSGLRISRRAAGQRARHQACEMRKTIQLVAIGPDCRRSGRTNPAPRR